MRIISSCMTGDSVTEEIKHSDHKVIRFPSRPTYEYTIPILTHVSLHSMNREALTLARENVSPSPRFEDGELDSPRFTPKELKEFQKSGFVRKNR